MFAAIVPKPLASAFALFFCFVSVLPSPRDANAGDAIATVPITNVAAAKIATSPRVVWFILFLSNVGSITSVYLDSDNQCYN
jgi:hypothetical protein